MILVDSNVVIDLVQGDGPWFEWSLRALDAARDTDELAINPVIYAEISVSFLSMEVLDELLGADFRRLALPYEAAFLAGKAHNQYRRRGGVRSAVLADFMIGAHAAVANMRLLTRDPRRYRTAFPTVRLIAP